MKKETVLMFDFFSTFSNIQFYFVNYFFQNSVLPTTATTNYVPIKSKIQFYFVKYL